MLVDSRVHAARLGQAQVGTEHLLLAAISDTSFVSARALGSILGDISAFRRALEAVLRPGVGSGTSPAGLSDEARMAVEGGVRAAKEMEHPVVGTGHLLLGILDDMSASWIPLAAALGVTRVTVTAEVAALGLSESSGDGEHEHNSGNGSNGSSHAGNVAHIAPDPQAVEALRREVAQLRLRLELLESQVS
jgi:ATP-dependent Clp protease ATP-binding subunit ClpA